jgi:sec-independent protein translocase protein TatC
MSASEEHKGETPQESTPVSSAEATEVEVSSGADAPAESADAPAVSYEQTTDHDHDSHYWDGYGEDGHSTSYEDPYTGESHAAAAVEPAAALVPATSTSGGGDTTPPSSTADEGDEDDDGMLRMSFLEHLEELRSRIIKALMGVGVAFLACLIFANEMWDAVRAPAATALKNLGYGEELAQLTPMDAFTTIWMKLPLLAATFVSSPWVLWQIWAFVAPGLYKKERRFAAPLILCTAGLFILGGLFAYFVAFRFGLEFLLGIGKDIGVKPVISIVDYFDLFVNVTLGIGIVFELPVVIFFLALLKIVSAKFLVEHSRYAILLIVVLAAVITPTPDVFNLMLFSVPMVVLYFVGVLSAYLLEVRRGQRGFPWLSLAVIVLSIVGVAGGIIWALVAKYGYKIVTYWPYLLK